MVKIRSGKSERNFSQFISCPVRTNGLCSRTKVIYHNDIFVRKNSLIGLNLLFFYNGVFEKLFKFGYRVH